MHVFTSLTSYDHRRQFNSEFGPSAKEPNTSVTFRQVSYILDQLEKDIVFDISPFEKGETYLHIPWQHKYAI